jgi:hypothetical protein
MVIGKADFKEVIRALADAQEKLNREIDPSVYTEAEFLKEMARLLASRPTGG